jgi:REP element-mobilizing transposase RayT
MPIPLAYFITWGTYGARLHGDPRGTVARSHNEYGDPIIEDDHEMWDQMNANLKYDPIFFDKQQMRFVESTIPAICERGYWTHHTDATGPDHVHIVLTSDHDPKIIRKLLKRWIGQELSTKWTLDPGRIWWAEGGSIRWLKNESYLRNAINYVQRQRATPEPM